MAGAAGRIPLVGFHGSADDLGDEDQVAHLR